MDDDFRHIIVADSLDGIGKGELAGYLMHAYLHQGVCEFTYNENPYKMEAGDCAIIRRGDFRQNREISYYADKLFVTPKYLSDVSKKISGFAANYWINRYTILDISRQLRNRRKTLTELSDYYGFSSPSYFTRYVQKYLGAKPTDMRD